MLENGYLFLKYVLSQGLGELAAGNDSGNEPQSDALLRTTLRYNAEQSMAALSRRYLRLKSFPMLQARPRQFPSFQ